MFDLPKVSINCQQLKKVGTSDHFALVTHIRLKSARGAAVPRINWLWKNVEWQVMRRALDYIDWKALLVVLLSHKHEL